MQKKNIILHLFQVFNVFFRRPALLFSLSVVTPLPLPAPPSPVIIHYTTIFALSLHTCSPKGLRCVCVQPCFLHIVGDAGVRVGVNEGDDTHLTSNRCRTSIAAARRSWQKASSAAAAAPAASEETTSADRRLQAKMDLRSLPLE